MTCCNNCFKCLCRVYSFLCRIMIITGSIIRHLIQLHRRFYEFSKQFHSFLRSFLIFKKKNKAIILFKIINEELHIQKKSYIKTVRRNRRKGEQWHDNNNKKLKIFFFAFSIWLLYNHLMMLFFHLCQLHLIFISVWFE